MSHWVDARATEEQERRKQVASVEEASTRFLDQLLEDIQSDLRQFYQHFPAERINVTRNVKNILVTAKSPSGAALFSVAVGVDPIAKVLSFRFGVSERLSQTIPVHVDSGNLVLDTSNTGVTMETLREYILTPVLFPGLTNDPSTLRHL